MSICALWVISLDAKSRRTKSLVFSRHYPIVIKKARNCGLLPNAQLPCDEDIADAILDELQVFRSSNEFVNRFDSCLLQKQAPMYSILDGSIWPIVAISKNHFTFACLPLLDVENVEKRKLNCSEMGPVAIAYSLLQNIADVVCSGQTDIIIEERLLELREYLFICMPFGTPREMDPATVRSILSPKDPVLIAKQKVPAWRTVAYKGKQHINLFVHETVRCVQYDRPEVPDICEVYGTIHCKAELEGAPEVSFDLISTSDSYALESISFHSCVQLSDALSAAMPVDDDKSVANDYGVRSIRFCPPLENFHLCHYKSSLEVPPILAYYQMTDNEDCAKIKISLKLWKNMKNSFEHLRISVPFFNRKSIRRIECSPASANFSILDKNTVMWNVGTKFPSKTLETSIEGTIYFSTLDEQIAKYDKFCTGLNSYILLSFKVADFVYSGMKIGNGSICVYPTSKFKSISGAEFVSTEYKVWNSLGDVIGKS